jgi:chemotaxis protein CheX
MNNFESQEVNGINVIHCPDIIDGKDMSKIEAAVKTWLVQATDLHVIDFKNVTSFAPLAYRPFVIFNQQLRRNNKNLFCMNLSDALMAQFKQDGLMTVFAPVTSLDEAKRKADKGHEKNSFDVEVINPFIAGVQSVLDTQAKIKVKIGKPYIKKAESLLPVDIIGSLALNGQKFKGSISLCFTKDTFFKVYEGMVGEVQTEINAENQDAVGELLNIIYGQAKTVLNDKKGFDLEKSRPTVMSGEKLKLHLQAKTTTIVLPFESPVGSFYMEISIDQQ